MASGLTFRPFKVRDDEGLWCEIRNAAYADWPNFTRMSADELRAWEQAPSFDETGMFFAETHDKAVGIVDAHVDRLRHERKGFIVNLAVLPGSRRRGFGKEMLGKALESLRARGMAEVETWIWDGARPALSFVESVGFKAMRTSSLMGRALGEVGEPQPQIPGLRIRKGTKTKADVELYNRLDNEAFSEHYNFRPVAIEETRWLIFKDLMIKPVDLFFAELEGEPVGFAVVGTDKAWLEQKGERRGWLLDLGVVKAHRRKGIGTALILQALDELRARGLTDVVLGVDEMNQTGAMRLYERMAFEVKSRSVAYLRAL